MRHKMALARIAYTQWKFSNISPNPSDYLDSEWLKRGENEGNEIRTLKMTWSKTEKKTQDLALNENIGRHYVTVCALHLIGAISMQNKACRPL